jgi:hypothetical protein
MVGNFPGMDKVINFRKRAQRFEERAATAIDPKPANTGKEWLTPGTAPPKRLKEHLRLSGSGSGNGGGTISGAIVPGHFPPKDTSLVTIFIGLAGALPTLTRLQELPRRAGVN